MPDGQVLEFRGVTKRFGPVGAVNGFTARVEPGAVTGFLGPNGAGKTTTLRILLGLVRATEGTATVGGMPYAQLNNPLETVGAVLEASSFHPGRSAANHLKVYAQAAGLPVSQVDAALGMVGLSDVAGRKVGGFSLGMRQRLGLAYALLGDPGVLVLDEPANGLDPEGIKWLRGLLRELARQGRTVLVSSHLLAEVQQTVDNLLIIAHGRLVFEGGLDDLTDPSEYATVVDSPDRAALSAALTAAGAVVEVLRSGLTVRGTDPGEVGAIAARAGVALSLLQRRGPALEEVFLDLVNGVRVHPSASGMPVLAAPVPVVPVDAAPADAAPVDAGPVAAVAVATSAVGDAETPTEDADVPGTGATDAPADVTEPSAPSSASEPHDAAFAVASTGIIDIIPPREHPPETETEHPVPVDAAPVDADAAPVDADPDVEAIGQIDDELETDLDESDETFPDRPWERRVKTESDEEADRFFSSFDADGNPVTVDRDHVSRSEKDSTDENDTDANGGELR
ncbi:ATP-binding cassette domain-containing protein [Microbacterium rhizomatis]|uniref:ATP-binding cassette domain-containing protein n=1 Tax=Microbacterium rhizomatis TaxID=1631477 RepID=A0A5J5J4R0_9MICO|nr:ATP-binding cassette domain-containing protein [Microbacterium rhizomatis]KAA9108268.1 ATP-binding cassette domain-containing protein [Microbacterium rhizomatis]